MSDEKTDVEVLKFKNKWWVNVDSFIIYLLKGKEGFHSQQDLEAVIKALEQCKDEAK